MFLSNFSKYIQKAIKVYEDLFYELKQEIIEAMFYAGDLSMGFSKDSHMQLKFSSSLAAQDFYLILSKKRADCR